MFKLLALLSCASFVFAHDEYRGKCPTFSPMQGFDWNRVRDNSGSFPKLKYKT